MAQFRIEFVAGLGFLFAALLLQIDSPQEEDSREGQRQEWLLAVRTRNGVGIEQLAQLREALAVDQGPGQQNVGRVREEGGVWS